MNSGSQKKNWLVSNLDMSADKVNMIFSRFPNYNGNGIVVSVKENQPDTTDIDFHGRVLNNGYKLSYFQYFHATDMATIIGGGGNTYYEGKGQLRVQRSVLQVLPFFYRTPMMPLPAL